MPLTDSWPSVCVPSLDVSPQDNSLRSYRSDPSLYRIVNADHGIENLTYGLGNMAGIASACAALWAANTPCNFTAKESLIATALFQSAQEKVVPYPEQAAPNTNCEDWADPSVAADSGCRVLSEDIVARWQFNEGSGSTAAGTAVSKNTGVLVHSPTWVTGQPGSVFDVGHAFDFWNPANNSNAPQYVRVASPADLPLGGSPRSMTAWIRPRSFPDSTYNGIVAY